MSKNWSVIDEGKVSASTKRRTREDNILAVVVRTLNGSEEGVNIIEVNGGLWDDEFSAFVSREEVDAVQTQPLNKLGTNNGINRDFSLGVDGDGD